ncbi:hypothetical protein ACFQ67_18415 [Streptomyces sp. NPDC056488]|uniref:hypothetical protein n=1 Tax=unclassified Streptomyces TaxID=2593676 RepID=UPI0036A5E1DB
MQAALPAAALPGRPGVLVAAALVAGVGEGPQLVALSGALLLAAGTAVLAVLAFFAVPAPKGRVIPA